MTLVNAIDRRDICWHYSNIQVEVLRKRRKGQNISEDLKKGKFVLGVEHWIFCLKAVWWFNFTDISVSYRYYWSTDSPLGFIWLEKWLTVVLHGRTGADSWGSVRRMSRDELQRYTVDEDCEITHSLWQIYRATHFSTRLPFHRHTHTHTHTHCSNPANYTTAILIPKQIDDLVI